MKLRYILRRRRRPVNRDIIDVKRRQKFVEMELRQVEATVARARRGSNR